MTIPKSIKIGAREISIDIVPLADMHGEYDPMTYKISLNEADNRMAQIETFWHELIHAIHDYNEMQTMLAGEMMSMKEGGGDPEIMAWNMEEQMTQGFASVFLQVIQDNNLLPLVK